MRIIEIDYIIARAQSRELHSKAEELSQINSKSSSKASNMANDWKGEANSAFFSSVARWQAENTSIQNDMAILAADINRVADEFEETEKKLKLLTDGISLGNIFK